MPSSTAQAALMASTYARAGLDLTRERDRPQYFEAHGTGTQAGDRKCVLTLDNKQKLTLVLIAREAQAISDVFFPKAYKGNSELLVGSIKTIIGHHEGGAGIASIIKASLILQHGQIPANLHFNTLNPDVRPFYHHLRIPTELEPWPALPEGCPRRTSVNSFGFGGTNAHAILESWGERDEGDPGGRHGVGCLFVLSAHSAQALAARAMQLRDYLHSHPEVNMERLARTLFQRGDFPFRAAFSATDAQQLARKLESSTLNKSTRVMTIPQSLPVRILGIITGQGAQWPTMGTGLHASSEVFRNAFLRMQQSLDSLPEKQDRPSWTLLGELSAPASNSRMNDASISQPLCTALQVALVDMLRAAGVQLAGIVAHSSGEVAAAYAAGYIDSHDAIRIAYLRGRHSYLAQGPDGQEGKMMAVGMSQAQAKAFCAEFGNAINVAASNSTRSCTLAGNALAISEAREKLEEAGVFARVLQVDKAYHSNHMLPVAQPYLESLRKCKINVRHGRIDGCPWYSSVWGSSGRSRSFMEQDEAASLKGQYWADNMINPVLFGDAIQRAIDEGQVYDFVVEIGPHPALKGPVSETITNMTAVSLPYCGLLKRGQPDVEAFTDALGLLWQSFSIQGSYPLVGYEHLRLVFASGEEDTRGPALLNDLPPYPFTHDMIHWRESRASALFRTQSQPPHQLLGTSMMLGSDGRREVHWRQVLRLADVPWLRGHKIQGEYLFPATGYVTMAYEAAIRLVPAAQTIKLMDLRDIDIFRAINLQPDSPGTEILFTMHVTDQSDNTTTGSWACYSAPADVDRGYSLADAPTQAKAHAEGAVHLVLGAPTLDVLPQRIESSLPRSSIDIGELYGTLLAIGHEYTDKFQAAAILRRLHHSVVTFPPTWSESELLTRPDMNPATLDTAMHGLLAAFSYPGDGRQRSVYLPKRIDSIRISMMSLARATDSANHELKADCFLTHADASQISGDLNVFASTSGETRVQVRGIHLSALPGSQLPDRELFAQEVWQRDAQFGIEPGHEACVTADRLKVGEMAARLVLFYCRKLVSEIKPFETILMSKNRKNLIDWVSRDLLPQTQSGVHLETKSTWLDEESENALDYDINSSGFRGSADVVLIRALGSNLPSITRGLTAAVKVAETSDALEQFYADGIGFREAIHNTTALVAQLSHRYPAMNIVEVGCSFGPALRRAVLDAVGKRRFKSYTVTNALAPVDQEPKVVFQPLDMAKDPVRQGFTEGTYDLVIATTSYSTNISEETLGYARKLLRAGGILILVAMTADYLPVRFILSVLPGSWLEKENGQPQIVGVSECDLMLKAAGFSGVDVSSSASFCSVMLSQALNEAVTVIRNPMSLMPQVGGEILVLHDPAPSDIVASLLPQVKEKLGQVGEVRDISGLDNICVPPGSIVLNLCDLDNPVFSQMEEPRFQGLQEVMRHAAVLLWVTKGAQDGTIPENSMVLGWSRSARLERISLRMQILDVAQETCTLEADMIVKLLLNLAANDNVVQDMIWTLEPELVLKNDALLISRVWPVDQMNELSDARWKEITVETAATSQFIKLSESGQLTVGQQYINDAKIPNWEILASSGCRFLFQGEQVAKRFCILRNPESSETLLVLTSPSALNLQDSGIDFVCRYDNHNYDSQALNYSRRLHHLLRRAMAEATLCQVSGHVWVHGAPAWLASELDLVALRRADIQIQQTTNDSDRYTENITFLHPFAMERDLVLAMPAGASTFICLDDSKRGDALVNLVRTYRPGMKVERLSLSPESCNGVVCRNLAQATLASLSQTLSVSKIRPTCLPANGCIIAVQDIPKENLYALPPVAVFDRTTVSTVTAKLLPPSHAGLFSADKTYLLIGLTGDFGISISNWMFENGARNVVLASRNPTESQPLVDLAAAVHGAILRFMAVDICSRTSLSAAWSEIHATMPPVTGIMHGAMVMRDQLFVDQPWVEFSAVLGPKVTGTRNLAALLEEEAMKLPTQQLDFVVLFSSAVAIAGNAGQTAYAASGWFMQGMASELQRHGIKASVVHIGPVRGLGYLHRQERRKEMEQSIHKIYSAIGEVDLLDMLAEAIAAAGSGPGRDAIGIITGIGSSISDYSWRDQPRLWHYIKSDADGGDAVNQIDGALSLKAQLAAATGDENTCLELLLWHFGMALCAMLHTKLEELETSMPVASLGIDSLVAVRVREWFMHQIGVEVSVLKVMSANVTQLELCKDVLVIWRKQNEL